MAEMMQFSGPAGMSDADLRLDALLAHRQAVADAPTEAEVNAKPDLLKVLLPLIMAQGLDLVSTEQLLRSKSPEPHVSGGKLWTYPRAYEQNPLPGMQSSVGRVGWGALEAALAALVLKKAPKVGVPARNALVGVHTGLARGNQDMTEDRQRQLGDSLRVWGK